MKLEEAQRKIQLLSRITPRNGASAAEAETVPNLARARIERFAVQQELARTAPAPTSRLTWVYWESLLGDYGYWAESFRGTGERSARRRAGGVHQTRHRPLVSRRQGSDGLTLVAGDFGVESFRTFLRENGPRSYSLAGV